MTSKSSTSLKSIKVNYSVYAELQAKNDALQAKYDGARKEVSAMKKEINSLKQRKNGPNLQQTETYADLKGKYDALYQKYHTLELHTQEYEKEIDDITVHNTSLRQSFSEHLDSLSPPMQQLQATKFSLHQMSEALTDHELDQMQTEQKMEQYKDLNTQLNEDNSMLRAENKKNELLLKNQKTSVRKREMEYKNKIEALQTEVSELTQEKHEIYEKYEISLDDYYQLKENTDAELKTQMEASPNLHSVPINSQRTPLTSKQKSIIMNAASFQMECMQRIESVPSPLIQKYESLSPAPYKMESIQKYESLSPPPNKIESIQKYESLSPAAYKMGSITEEERDSMNDECGAAAAAANESIFQKVPFVYSPIADERKDMNAIKQQLQMEFETKLQNEKQEWVKQTNELNKQISELQKYKNARPILKENRRNHPTDASKCKVFGWTVF